MSQIIGLGAVYIIFACFAVAGVVAFLWLAWAMVTTAIESELAPYIHLVRALRRKR